MSAAVEQERVLLVWTGVPGCGQQVNLAGGMFIPGVAQGKMGKVKLGNQENIEIIHRTAAGDVANGVVRMVKVCQLWRSDRMHKITCFK